MLRSFQVVIDYRENSNADTGDFELVYKQKLSSCQAYLGAGLSLHGTHIILGEKRSNIGSTIAAVNVFIHSIFVGSLFTKLLAMYTGVIGQTEAHFARISDIIDTEFK
jgi:hypothetical protein